MQILLFPAGAAQSTAGEGLALCGWDRSEGSYHVTELPMAGRGGFEWWGHGWWLGSVLLRGSTEGIWAFFGISGLKNAEM